MSNEVDAVIRFSASHWEWLLGFIVSIVAALISWNAFMLARRKDKEKARNRLIDAGLSEWRLNGQASQFLLGEYSRLKNEGWTENEFEKIYKTIALRHKGKLPKRKLFH
jgi:hypothetical protein